MTCEIGQVLPVCPNVTLDVATIEWAAPTAGTGFNSESRPTSSHSEATGTPHMFLLLTRFFFCNIVS